VNRRRASEKVVDWVVLMLGDRRMQFRRYQAVTGARLRARATGSSVTFDIDPSARFRGRCRFEVGPRTVNHVTIGPRTRIDHEVQVNLRGGTFIVGADTHIRRFVSFNVDGHIEIGNQVVLSNGTYIHCAERVTIDDMTIIGEYSTIADSAHVRTPEDVPVQQVVSSAPVTMGRNVWLGPKCTIIAGVTIGDMAFVGANSVVTRSVEPWWLVAGVPAKPIRRLEAAARPAQLPS
jgi:maltose O-acetyltransferase